MKYAGGVYLGTDSLDPYEVELENAYGESTTCLDLNQVATEIANLAVPTEEYTVVVPTELIRYLALQMLRLPARWCFRQQIRRKKWSIPMRSRIQKSDSWQQAE